MREKYKANNIFGSAVVHCTPREIRLGTTDHLSRCSVMQLLAWAKSVRIGNTLERVTNCAMIFLFLEALQCVTRQSLVRRAHHYTAATSVKAPQDALHSLHTSSVSQPSRCKEHHSFTKRASSLRTLKSCEVQRPRRGPLGSALGPSCGDTSNTHPVHDRTTSGLCDDQCHPREGRLIQGMRQLWSWGLGRIGLKVLGTKLPLSRTFHK